MKRIMCYCFAISMIQHGSSEMSCTEPKLLVKETYCAYDNVTSLTMYTFNKESILNAKESFLNDGCDIEFNQSYFNNSFFIECEIEEVNCFREESVKLERDFYHLECEEVELFGNDTIEFVFNNLSDVFSNATTIDGTVLPLYNIGNLSEATETAVTYIPNDANDTSSEFDISRKETTTNVPITSIDENENTSEKDEYSNEATVSQVSTDFNNSWSEFDEFNKTKISTVSTDINVLKKENAGALEKRDILAILAYTVAALGATIVVAFGAYRLKNLMQSGTYLIPDAPSPPGFIELA